MRNLAKSSAIILTGLLLASTALTFVFVSGQLLPTFVMDASPDNLSVQQGDVGTTYITITSTGNWSEPVSLSFTGAPTGVSFSFDNNPVQPPAGGSAQSTATISVDVTVPAGYYHMTLIGSSGGDVRNHDYNLQVTPLPQPGDFGISVSPQDVSVQPGGSGSVTITVSSINGFSNPVTLTSNDAPSGVTVSFSPSQITPPSGGSANAGVTISVASYVQSGYYPLTLTGSSFSGPLTVIIQHSTQLNLQVSSPQDFTITINPSSASVEQGKSTTATVIISPVGGFSSAVGLSASNGVPSGVQVSFSPNPTGPGSSTMSLNVASSANTGTFSFQILGSSGSLNHATTFTLTISQAAKPSFSISSAANTVPVSQGGSGSVTIFISSVNGFSSPVNTYTSWVGPAPSGITVSGPGTLTPAAGGVASGTLTLTATNTASVGNYQLSVVGTSGSLSDGLEIGVQILTGTGGFTMSLSTPTVTLTQGSVATSILTIQASGVFSTPVSLYASTANGLSVTFANNPLTPQINGKASTQVTITAAGSLNTGTYNVPITGSGGSISRSVTLTITVNEAESSDFSIALGPSTITLTQGSSANSVVGVLSQNGFNAPVSLSASWQGSAPSGISYTLPSPITPLPNTIATSTLSINALAGSSVGTFTLLVTGQSGSLIHSATVTLQIAGSSVTTTSSIMTSTTSSSTTTSAPKCFIATATFGSQLAPQVQFLRTFRDQQIMNTFAGRSFMIAFNAWYYSFSPQVA
ncbi:MAG TPA: CFI-box-CTERM domain-containing protein, partial [Terriglobales bacterium]|nr:CFI-box-CTERM domain-containing protein [Terriglobales bacterium]